MSFLDKIQDSNKDFFKILLDLNYLITLSLEFYCYCHSDHSLCMFPFHKYTSANPVLINSSFENNQY